jgi:4-hydroxy-tetrahydrodipicolinate reductase
MEQTQERMMSEMRIVIAGAAGRMGRMLIQAVDQTQGMRLAGALERPGSPALGQDASAQAGCGASDVLITDNALEALLHADAIIDFTTPASTVALAALAAQARVVHVIGTTGLSADDLARIDAAARHAVVVRSGNMSLGVNLLAGLVKRATAHAPSAPPAVPLPARVDTAPSGATARIAWLFMSVTNATPEAPTTTEKGALKRAALPTPPAKPAAPARPASVRTKPVGATVRTVCAPESAM